MASRAVPHQVDLLVGHSCVFVEEPQHLGHVGGYRGQLLGHSGIAYVQSLAAPVQDDYIEVASRQVGILNGGIRTAGALSRPSMNGNSKINKIPIQLEY